MCGGGMEEFAGLWLTDVLNGTDIADCDGQTEIGTNGQGQIVGGSVALGYIIACK